MVGPSEHCMKNCKLCTDLVNCSRIRSHSCGKVFKVKASESNCTAVWVVYCIFCPSCGMQYVGMTQNLKERMANHRSVLQKVVREGGRDLGSDFVKSCAELYSHLASHSPSHFKVIILQTLNPPFIPLNATNEQKKVILDNSRDRLKHLENIWMWNKLRTISPMGLNVNDGFDCQTKKPRVRAR